MLPPDAADHLLRGTANAEGAFLWRQRHRKFDLLLRVCGKHLRVFRFQDVAILIRGCAVPRTATSTPEPGDIAQEIWRIYSEHDDLPIDQLDGSFTVVLADGAAGRLLLYRNLVGNGFTYYAEVNNGFAFASNLADMVDSV